MVQALGGRDDGAKRAGGRQAVGCAQPMGYDKDFGVESPKCNEKMTEDLGRGNSIIQFMFSQNPSGCHVEKEL